MIDLAAYRPQLPALRNSVARLPVRPEMIAVGVVAGLGLAVFAYAFGHALMARRRRQQVAMAMMTAPRRRRRPVAEIDDDAPPTAPLDARKLRAARDDVPAARDN